MTPYADIQLIFADLTIRSKVYNKCYVLKYAEFSFGLYDSGQNRWISIQILYGDSSDSVSTVQTKDVVIWQL